MRCCRTLLLVGNMALLTVSCQKKPAEKSHADFSQSTEDYTAILLPLAESGSSKRELILKPSTIQCAGILASATISLRPDFCAAETTQQQAEIVKEKRFDFSQLALCGDIDDKMREQIRDFAETGKPFLLKRILAKKIAELWGCKRD